MPWHWSDDCPLARTSLWYCTFLEFLEHCVLLWLSLFYLIMRHRRVASPHHLVKMMKFLRPEKPLQGQISGFGGTITKRLASLMLLSHHLEILLSIDDAIISVGTNPKNSNFEHSNFGMSELRTSRTYFKKYKSNSNFKGRTSNFYKDEYIMILRHFIRNFLKIYFSVVNSRKMLLWFLSHFLEVTQNEGRNISV